MKPGNLYLQGAKSGGKTRDEDSIFTHIGSSVCGFFVMCCFGERYRNDWCNDERI